MSLLTASLVICVTILISFFISSIVIYGCFGTLKLKKIQYMLSPLKFSTELDEHINLTLDKYNDKQLTVSISDGIMTFSDEDEVYLILNIKNKFFAYGIVEKFRNDSVNYKPYKPSYLTLLKILEIENSLNTTEVVKSKDDVVVI